MKFPYKKPIQPVQPLLVNLLPLERAKLCSNGIPWIAAASKHRQRAKSPGYTQRTNRTG
jgi:hypothetical protein